MRRRPEQIDQLFLDLGETGLASDIGARILDNEGTITSRVTGFVEFPAGSGLYYLEDYEFPDTYGTYTILYDWDAGVAAPGFTATEDLEITSSAGEPFDGETYADTEELFRILKIRVPSDEQELAATRVLTAATYEIDQEICRDDDDPVSGAEVPLAQQVCLERAAELWKLQEVQFVGGVLTGSDFGSAHVARNTWDKYAFTLAPLKRGWGIA